MLTSQTSRACAPHDDAGADAEPACPTLPREPVDLREPGWLTQPRAMAQRLRQRGRVHRDTMGLWLLLGHADCRAAMQSNRLSRDPRLSSGYAKLRPFVADSALEQAAERFMLFNDPPVHTRLRRVVAAAFTPASTRQLRESITATTHALLDALPADGGVPFDFMRSFAQQLPIRVICDLLGVEGGDVEQAKAWSDAASLVVEPLATRQARADGARAVAELTAFLQTQVARRRAHPGNTVLDRMIAAQRDDPGFDDDALLANLILLFIAGHETTTNLLGNGLLALLRHPDQLALLKREPALLPSAVEEMLRYESPTNMVARTTREPWAIGEVTVPAGEVLYCMVGAANHDPAVFDDPGRFDLRRSPNPQLSFGGGVHYCVGAPLARLEAELAFDLLLRRFPVLELVDDAPPWRPMINLRGLQALWLRAGGAGTVAAGAAGAAGAGEPMHTTVAAGARVTPPDDPQRGPGRPRNAAGGAEPGLPPADGVGAPATGRSAMAPAPTVARRLLAATAAMLTTLVQVSAVVSIGEPGRSELLAKSQPAVTAARMAWAVPAAPPTRMAAAAGRTLQP